MPDLGPDLQELAGFDPGTAGPALPPAEVRRLGDRRRRRTTALAVTGAALAAAVAVGTPLALTSGGGGREVQPAPSVPSPTPTRDTSGVTWLTTVPEDFPLAAGLPTPLTDAAPSLLPGCTDIPMDAVARTVVSHLGESEDRSQRTLLLFADDAAAQAALAEVRQAVEGCAEVPAPGGGAVVTTEPVGAAPGADVVEQAYGAAEQVQQSDGLTSQLTLALFSRTGNALLVDSSFTAAGGDTVLARQTELMMERATAPLQEMCRFAEHPCTVSSGQGSAGPPSSVGTTGDGSEAAAGGDLITDPDDIPDDFPLSVGSTADADSELSSSVGGRGAPFDEVCAAQAAWPGGGTTDELAVRKIGPEYSLTRELVTYETADRAAAAVDALRAAVSACPESPASDGNPANDRLVQLLDADTGYESSLTFGFTYREGLGGALFQVVRVGRAVLATRETGEYAADSLAGGVPLLTADNQQVTERMCSWTEAGC